MQACCWLAWGTFRGRRRCLSTERRDSRLEPGKPCKQRPYECDKVKTMLSRLRHLAAVLMLTALSCSAATPVLGYKVVAEYPHSTDSYTEGFFYLDGLFYEGTGIAGHSALLVIQPETGKPVQKRDLPPQYFGEGIIDWGPNVYQWTWQSHICFVYDRFTLRPIKEFTYTGEGWGMTRTEKELITSDGTPILRFRNPDTFKETHHIVVRDGAREIEQRAGIHQGRDLRQRLALRPHCPHRSAYRTRDRLD
jgi:glutamine cyclotransferase